MATISLLPLPVLPSNPKESDFNFFHRQLENYFAINNATDMQKMPILLNSLGQDGLLIFDGLSEPKDTYNDGLQRLKEYFSGNSSILLRRKYF